MASNVKTVSQKGYEELKEKLEYLTSVGRAEVAKKLKEARSFGDLSENAEYDAAKEEQASIEAQIAELQFTIDNVTIISDDDITTHEVNVGSVIKIRDLELDEVETLQIVGFTESNPDEGKISDDSPIGMAALKKKVGDIFEVAAPVGTLKFELLEISRK